MYTHLLVCLVNVHLLDGHTGGNHITEAPVFPGTTICNHK